MILAKSDLIKLDYDIKSDILAIDWPDLRTIAIPEALYTFKIIIDNLKYYDIKRLFINSKKNVTEISETDYKAIAHYFAVSLKSTRLAKIARIEAPLPEQHKYTTQLGTVLKNEIPVFCTYHNFIEESAAYKWLIEA